ncbi:MAG TPA: hypothetical protein VMB03_34070 [Bryobacteraceae bacterium]|nr:hypothetical protein [Bryobacteraceae bacterium]
MSVRYRPVFALGFPFFPLVFLCAILASTPARAAVSPCDLASTNEFLNARLAFWQQRLNLQDWKLSVVASHPSELKPETLGNIHWDTPTKTAVVRVLSISDYKMACPAALSDMELTVVHELVHLTLSPLRSSATNREEEEHTVNQIAEALLKLDRQSRARRNAPVAAVPR